MTRVLLASRGLTAARVARSVRSHGFSPVGVVAEYDRDARWVSLLDDAVEVPAYDDVSALVAAAQRLGASLIHPGVGFAAESEECARACVEAGLTWVGPSAHTLAQVADKVALAALAQSLNIPIPRTVGPLASVEDVTDAAAVVGTPLVLKMQRGGGGRGIVVVGSAEPPHIRVAWEQVAGLGPCIAQERLADARHVEVQMLADCHGQVLIVGTRECSLQRRCQKIMEEAPAPFLPDSVRQQMEQWTRDLMGACAYVGVGTCEFLLTSDHRVRLLEVNARLQVEHGVSEEVTGLDLVRAQCVLAQGGSVDDVLALCAISHPCTDRSGAPAAGPEVVTEAGGYRLRECGHALEVRLYAEDPHTLVPSSEDLTRLSVPVSLASERRSVARGEHELWPRLRVDRALYDGDALRSEVSEPLALLITSGRDRAETLSAMDDALAQVEVEGPPTLAPLARRLLALPAMRACSAHSGQSDDDVSAGGYGVTTDLVDSLLREESTDVSSQVPSTGDDDGAPHMVGSPARTPADADVVQVRAPLAGVVVSCREAGPVEAGEVVVVVEAMKMRLPVPAPLSGLLAWTDTSGLQVGQGIQAGQLLATVTDHERQTLSSDSSVAAPAVPRGGQRRNAAQRMSALIDPGSAIDVVDEDAVLTARARLRGREIALWAQDPTVQAGTMGLAGSRRVANLIDAAADDGVPIVCLIDGGGARIQEGIDALAGVGLILAAQSRARGRTLSVGVVTGAGAGGSAYAPALTDVLIMVDGVGHLFLTGPAIVAASTGEHTTAEELGGARVHAEHAGTAHCVVPDEAAAWRTVQRLVAFAPVRLPVGASERWALPLRPGGGGPQVSPGDGFISRCVPDDLRQSYDVRRVLRQVVDRGDLVELRADWAPQVVTAWARVEGIPVGIVASQPCVLAGAIDTRAAQKIAEHVDLCGRLGFALLTVVDTPGFMPGSACEREGIIRLGAGVVSAYALYEARGGLLLTLVTRRAYGGAYVALGSRALSGGRSAAWPQARIGIMDATSAVTLTQRRRLAQAEHDCEDASVLRQRLVADYEAAQSADHAATSGWVDEVIQPPQTRAWVARCLLEAVQRSQPPSLQVTKIGGVRHPGDGWVECACGSRHWGLNGAAGVLIWRDTGAGSLEVLLQLRSLWTHHGGTWGVPGGAVASGESPAEAALRECEEETGIPAQALTMGRSHVQEHGSWRYSTFAAQIDADARWDHLVALDGESTSLAWVPLRWRDGAWARPGEGQLPLLPSLEVVWEDLARLLPAKREISSS